MSGSERPRASRPEPAVSAVRARKAFAWLEGQVEGFSGTATHFVLPA